ncbi:ubiquitin carboxyl-terminal hydrolase CYLD [Anabrus simplex]|uniref:ubiquitin carboxyl-terminal hydrolase CYLD n=1 Tax=Anabrus simplex TaxID=316456 RepID=UPI0035A27399
MSGNSYNDSKYCVVKNTMVVRSLNLSDFTENIDERKVIRLGSLVIIQLESLGLYNNLVGVSDFDCDGCGCEADEKIWVCHRDNLLFIPPVLWQPFQGISSPFERKYMAEEEELCYDLAQVEQGHRVFLLPEADDALHLDAVAALVRYKGPVPLLGPGHYYGLEILAKSSLADCDGTIFGKRYFACKPNTGIFVSLSRVYPYRREKLQACVNTYSRPIKYSEVISSSSQYKSDQLCASMPSNEKRTQHYNEGNLDSTNFTTTLVLHLKEKESMPRSQIQKVERTEKLIDLEPNSNSGEESNSPLKVGDRVVWFVDSEPEQGVVRWIGYHGDNRSDIMVGVECDNPVSKGTGDDHVQYFKARKDHAAFIPLMSLVKAEDFFSKPADHVKKKKNLKLIENCNNPKVSRSQIPSTGHSEIQDPSMWTSPLREFNDVPESAPASKEKREDNVCRSEYVFSEPNTETLTPKIDNIKKRVGKDSRNNNCSRKVNNSLSSYPIGEASPRENVSCESYALNRRVGSDHLMKNDNEPKIRHSYSQDVNTRNGIDLSDFGDDAWLSVNDSKHTRPRVREEKRSSATGSNGKATKMNNAAEPLLEIVGEGLTIQGKSPESQDHLLSTSPSISSDGSSYYENPDSPEDALPSDLGVGSVVEVLVKQTPRYGVIRWIGTVPGDKKSRKVAGIEMEEEQDGCTDGTFSGRRYFQCNPRKAMFVGLSHCRKDSRFQDVQPSANDVKLKSFRQMGCPVIPGVVRPISWKEDGEVVCGKFRGIQGHHNSCYLDATLFSMFTFTSVFDSLLFRPRTENDISHYEEVQRVLREEIVNPLRQNLYVRADRVMKLRTLLENLSSVTGLTSEEKDPEEFLTSLVAQILRAEPFLKLSSGQEAYHYQLFVEKDEHLVLPSVQQLFDQSFLTSDIKLKEVPSCLIIQMPRFGKSFKMYPRILPSQLLDVTDIIEDSPRQCTVCGKLAEYECKECFDQCGNGLESIAFCGNCLDTAHSHQRRSKHARRRLSVPVEFSIIQEHCHIPRLYMELFAVVCIETSHYVAFVKCGSGSDAPWCFFDSMADRKGEQNGYNIPEMVLCPKLPYWLSDEGARSLGEIKDDRLLPEHAKRLLCDAYMCMYQSPDVMMYR